MEARGGEQQRDGDRRYSSVMRPLRYSIIWGSAGQRPVENDGAASTCRGCVDRAAAVFRD
jgi:hypothetical protein